MLITQIQELNSTIEALKKEHEVKIQTSSEEIDTLRVEVKELQSENAQLQEANRHMLAEKEMERVMKVQADKAETEYFNLEATAKEEEKRQESTKTVGPRLNSAVGNEGTQKPKESQPSGLLIKQINKSPTPSEAGGNPGGDDSSWNRGKQVDDKIDLHGWPTIPGFRAWKLKFKKAVAAASRHSTAAFKWITEVENATSFLRRVSQQWAIRRVGCQIVQGIRQNHAR